MKRILVGLIALGLAIGLMLSCELNPAEVAEILTENGLLAEGEDLAEDIVITETDSAGRVGSTFTFKTDGTWEYVDYTFENSGATTDIDDDGTLGEGAMVQTGGFKGTWSYDAATKKITFNWFGNVYYDMPTADTGFAWSGDWGSTLTDPAGTYAINTEPADGSALDAGDQPFSGGGGAAVLSTVETVVWDFSDIDVSTSVATPDALDYVMSTSYMMNLFVDGTYYYMTETYASGTYDNYLSTTSYHTEAVAIDNDAMTLTFTYEDFTTDTAGTVTPGTGVKAVYSWTDPQIWVPDTTTYDPTDYTTTSTTNDVTAGDDEGYQITLVEELTDDVGAVSGTSFTYVLTEGDLTTTGNWDIDDANTAGATATNAGNIGFDSPDFSFWSLPDGWMTM